jgi:hypothetical protein
LNETNIGRGAKKDLAESVDVVAKNGVNVWCLCLKVHNADFLESKNRSS